MLYESFVSLYFGLMHNSKLVNFDDAKLQKFKMNEKGCLSVFGHRIL